MGTDSQNLEAFARADDGAFWAALGKTGFINIEAAKARAADMGDGDFVEVFGVFRENLPREIEMMDRFLKESDLPNFAIIVHGLKTSLATIGALRLSEIARQLENAAKDADGSFCHANSLLFSENLREFFLQLSHL